MKLSGTTIRGLTLVEIMMSAGCGSLVLAAVLTASVALQRSFAAVQGYSVAEGDQLRVLDYIAMDCRRALSASIANNVLTLTVPLYYDPCAQNGTVTPTLSNGTVTYKLGASGNGGDCPSVTNTSVTIKYSQSGSNFTREVISQKSDGSTSDVSTAIATNVASFTVTNVDLTTSLSCNIMFFPTFRYTTGGGTWRSGSSSPSDATGADGDLYVIDPTAADQTTVGNVYRRAGGTYSLLQNVKATTVYCNTFLRNAGARQ
jgi:Tfp pilus assembly protein PilW